MPKLYLFDFETSSDKQQIMFFFCYYYYYYFVFVDALCGCEVQQRWLQAIISTMAPDTMNGVLPGYMRMNQL